MTVHKKRIGLLIHDLAVPGNYSHSLWTSALAYCEMLGYDLLLIPDPQRVDSYVSRQVKTAVFRLIDPRRIDGLLFSSSVKYFRDPHWWPDFLQEFSHIPKVCIGESLPGVHSIVVDNATGMQALVEHLITVHGFVEQAFVRGPLNAEDGNARYEAWVTTLAKHGLPVEPELVLQGNFLTIDSPERLAQAWLGGRKFSAVVAASDPMAHHLMAVFKQYGIRVPQDVAVVGFDDNPESRFSEPPLSSVFQSVRDQVEVAIDLLSDVWAGRNTPSEVVVPTTLHIRGSCGCVRKNWTVDFKLQRSLLAAASMGPEFGDALLAMDYKKDKPIERAFDVLSALDTMQSDGHFSALGISAADVDASSSRIYLQTLANIRLNQANGPTQVSRTLELLLEIAGAGRLSSAADLLKANFSHLGLTKFCFSVFPVLADEGVELGRSTQAATIGFGPGAAIDPGGVSLIPKAMWPEPAAWVKSTEFNAKLLAPDEWFNALEPSSLLVLPIVTRTEWLGLLVCEIVPGNEAVLLQLQGALAFVCEQEVLIERLMRQNEAKWSLGFVQAARSRTTDNLVRGVAHEINTPLGNCVSVVSTLSDRLTELKDAVSSGKIGRQNLTAFIMSSVDGLDVLDRSLSRITMLTNTFNKVSASEFFYPTEHFDLVREAQVMLDQYKQEQASSFVTANIECSGPVPVQVSRLHIQELLKALISNALEHAFEEGMQCTAHIAIVIEALEDGRTVRLRFSDNGAGIPTNLQDDIFEPFFSTKRSLGKVGLGLAIVRSVVVDGLSGSVTCFPNPGGGTVFEVMFQRGI